MKINSKGQITVPADLLRQCGFFEGDEIEVVADGNDLKIIHALPQKTRGTRIVERMRGKATTDLTTDELMELVRGD